MNQNRQLPYQEGNQIVIFDAVLASAPKKELRRSWGIVCLALSFGFLLFLLGPVLTVEIRARLYQTHRPVVKNSQKLGGFSQLLWLSNQGIIAPADWHFSLIIPKIGINAKVVSGVDIASNKEIKQALKIGVAHAKGTALPDEQGTIYLFGHSTDYPWHIQQYQAWLYSLKDLNPKDQIIIAYNQKLSTWEVKEKRIVESNDLTYLLPKEGGQQLVLQTCWPPGTTLKRLVVIAEPQALDKTALLGLN